MSGLGKVCPIILLLARGRVVIIIGTIIVFLVFIPMGIVPLGPGTVHMAIILGFCPFYDKHAAYSGAFFRGQQARISADGNFN